MRLIFDFLYFLRIVASLYQRNHFNKNEITNINIGCFSLINFLNLFRFFISFLEKMIFCICESLLDGEVKKYYQLIYLATKLIWTLWILHLKVIKSFIDVLVMSNPDGRLVRQVTKSTHVKVMTLILTWLFGFFHYFFDFFPYFDSKKVQTVQKCVKSIKY